MRHVDGRRYLKKKSVYFLLTSVDSLETVCRNSATSFLCVCVCGRIVTGQGFEVVFWNKRRKSVEIGHDWSPFWCGAPSLNFFIAVYV